jgi:hypothetical protein
MATLKSASGQVVTVPDETVASYEAEGWSRVDGDPGVAAPKRARPRRKRSVKPRPKPVEPVETTPEGE